jgi:hypothetical protein
VDLPRHGSPPFERPAYIAVFFLFREQIVDEKSTKESTSVSAHVECVILMVRNV